MSSGEVPPTRTPPSKPPLASKPFRARFKVTDSKQDFLLFDGQLLGLPLPGDATAVRVVRVGGGSALHRLMMLGRDRGRDRDLEAVPAAVSAAEGQGLAAWDGPVVCVSKTIHAGGSIKEVVNFQLQYRTTVAAAAAASDAAGESPTAASVTSGGTAATREGDWRTVPGVAADASLDLAPYYRARHAGVQQAELTWPTTPGGGVPPPPYVLKASVQHAAVGTASRETRRARGCGAAGTAPGTPGSGSDPATYAAGTPASRIPSRAGSGRSDVTAASLPPLETEYPDEPSNAPANVLQPFVSPFASVAGSAAGPSAPLHRVLFEHAGGSSVGSPTSPPELFGEDPICGAAGAGGGRGGGSPTAAGKGGETRLKDSYGVLSPDVILRTLQQASQPPLLPPDHAAAPNPATAVAAEAMEAMMAAAAVAARQLRSSRGGSNDGSPSAGLQGVLEEASPGEFTPRPRRTHHPSDLPVEHQTYAFRALLSDSLLSPTTATPSQSFALLPLPPSLGASLPPASAGEASSQVPSASPPSAVPAVAAIPPAAAAAAAIPAAPTPPDSESPFLPGLSDLPPPAEAHDPEQVDVELVREGEPITGSLDLSRPDRRLQDHEVHADQAAAALKAALEAASASSGGASAATSQPEGLSSRSGLAVARGAAARTLSSSRSGQLQWPPHRQLQSHPHLQGSAARRWMHGSDAAGQGVSTGVPAGSAARSAPSNAYALQDSLASGFSEYDVWVERLSAGAQPRYLRTLGQKTGLRVLTRAKEAAAAPPASPLQAAGGAAGGSSTTGAATHSAVSASPLELAARIAGIMPLSSSDLDRVAAAAVAGAAAAAAVLAGPSLQSEIETAGAGSDRPVGPSPSAARDALLWVLGGPTAPARSEPSTQGSPGGRAAAKVNLSPGAGGDGLDNRGVVAGSGESAAAAGAGLAATASDEAAGGGSSSSGGGKPSGNGVRGEDWSAWAVRGAPASTESATRHSRATAATTGLSGSGPSLDIKPSGEITGVLDMPPPPTVNLGPSGHSLAEDDAMPSIRDLYATPRGRGSGASSSAAAAAGGSSGAAGGSGSLGGGGAQPVGFEMHAVLSGSEAAMVKAAATKLEAEARDAVEVAEVEAQEVMAQAPAETVVWTATAFVPTAPSGPSEPLTSVGAGVAEGVVFSPHLDQGQGGDISGGSSSGAGDGEGGAEADEMDGRGDDDDDGSPGGPYHELEHELDMSPPGRSSPTAAVGQLGGVEDLSASRTLGGERWKGSKRGIRRHCRSYHHLLRPRMVLPPVPEDSEGRDESAGGFFIGPLAHLSLPSNLYGAGGDAGGSAAVTHPYDIATAASATAAAAALAASGEAPPGAPVRSGGAAAASGGAVPDSTGLPVDEEELLRSWWALQLAAQQHSDEWVYAPPSVPARDMAVLRSRYAEAEGTSAAAAEAGVEAEREAGLRGAATDGPSPGGGEGAAAVAVAGESATTTKTMAATAAEEETAAEARSSRESEEAAAAAVDEMLAVGPAAGAPEEASEAAVDGDEVLLPVVVAVAPSEGSDAGEPGWPSDLSEEQPTMLQRQLQVETPDGRPRGTPTDAAAPAIAVSAGEPEVGILLPSGPLGELPPTSGLLEGDTDIAAAMLGAVPVAAAFGSDRGAPLPAAAARSPASPYTAAFDVSSINLLPISELEAIPQLEPLALRTTAAYDRDRHGGQIAAAAVQVRADSPPGGLPLAEAVTTSAPSRPPGSTGSDAGRWTHLRSRSGRGPLGEGRVGRLQRASCSGGVHSGWVPLSAEEGSVLAAEVLRSWSGRALGQCSALPLGGGGGAAQGGGGGGLAVWLPLASPRSGTKGGGGRAFRWPVERAETRLRMVAASMFCAARDLLEGLGYGQPLAPYGPEQGLATLPLLRPPTTLWAQLPWPLAPLGHAVFLWTVLLTCAGFAAVDTVREAVGWLRLAPGP